MFVATQRVFAAPVLAGIKFDDAVYETELGAVREKRKRFFICSHFFSGSITE